MMRLTLAKSVMLALVVLALGMTSSCSKKPLELKSAQLMPQPKTIDPALGLTDKQGNKISFGSVRGRWVLLFFGYTHCADVCPLELQQLALMLKQFDDQHLDKPVVAFISVDPERDNNDMLKQYASSFYPTIAGISGHPDELSAIASSFDAGFNRVATIKGKEYVIEAGAAMPANAGNQYVVNHSSRIYIINPDLRYIGSFPPPHEAAVMFHDMQQLMEASR